MIYYKLFWNKNTTFNIQIFQCDLLSLSQGHATQEKTLCGVFFLNNSCVSMEVAETFILKYQMCLKDGIKSIMFSLKRQRHC